MTDFETKYRDLVAGVEALADDFDTTVGFRGAATALRALLASSPAEREGEDCNCGWGGVHDPDNPRCKANAPAPVSSGEAGLPATMLRPVGCICGGEDGPCTCGPAPVVTPSTEDGPFACKCGRHLPCRHCPQENQ